MIIIVVFLQIVHGFGQGPIHVGFLLGQWIIVVRSQQVIEHVVIVAGLGRGSCCRGTSSGNSRRALRFLWAGIPFGFATRWFRSTVAASRARTTRLTIVSSWTISRSRRGRRRQVPRRCLATLLWWWWWLGILVPFSPPRGGGAPGSGRSAGSRSPWRDAPSTALVRRHGGRFEMIVPFQHFGLKIVPRREGRHGMMIIQAVHGPASSSGGRRRSFGSRRFGRERRFVNRDRQVGRWCHFVGFAVRLGRRRRSNGPVDAGWRLHSTQRVGVPATKLKRHWVEPPPKDGTS
mmetsp:Transcript_16659/g.45768  ORF Transcript_16659/g.45768 Transcript_16659/m.45768 type:complete len:290 (+) Transcript_16659:2098-2967(+)